jgi:FkbM family methyltransferase
MLNELLKNQKKSVISVEALKIQLGKKPVVFYGAGASAFDTLEALRAYDIFPVAFSDTDCGKWHTEFYGLEVVPPAELVPKFGSDILVFACFSINYTENIVDVTALLNSLGITDIRHISFFMCCPELFLPINGKRNLLGIFDVINDEQKAGIEQSYSLFADENSRLLYAQMIGFRCYLHGFEPLLGGEVDYFAFDYFAPVEDEVFIDCGAYLGDTLQEFLKTYKDSFYQYIAFEPDPDNFDSLSKCVKSLATDATDTKIKLFQAAVSDTESFLRFDGGHGHSSKVSHDAGGEFVPSVTLDTALDGAPITFIKIDVEGFERNVLLGAKNIIARCRPVLAVSAYHMLDDLWRLPVLLNELCANYKFFFAGWNFIAGYLIFAVPDERIRGV